VLSKQLKKVAFRPNTSLKNYDSQAKVRFLADCRIKKYAPLMLFTTP